MYISHRKCPPLIIFHMIFANYTNRRIYLFKFSPKVLAKHAIFFLNKVVPEVSANEKVHRVWKTNVSLWRATPPKTVTFSAFFREIILQFASSRHKKWFTRRARVRTLQKVYLKRLVYYKRVEENQEKPVDQGILINVKSFFLCIYLVKHESKTK